MAQSFQFNHLQVSCCRFFFQSSDTSDGNSDIEPMPTSVNIPIYFFLDMVVSGVPRENGIHHASEIASMALDLVLVCKTFRIPHKPNTQLKIRAGIHSGTRVHRAVEKC